MDIAQFGVRQPSLEYSQWMLSANRYYGSYMGGIKALCLFTTVLGHKTMVRQLTTALDKIPGLTPVYVFTEVEDYARYPAPWWARVNPPSKCLRHRGRFAKSTK